MKKTIFFVAIIFLFNTGCKKDWLEEKRDIQLIVPATLSDLRLLLNNGIALPYDNQGIGEIAAGDFYITTDYWKTLGLVERSAYTWKDVYKGSTTVIEWNNAYNQIEIANVVLEALTKISPSTGQEIEWNDIKGTALFIRARAFFNLANIFAPSYNAQNLGKPGVHLRLTADINAAVERATVGETFARITSDLKDAIALVKTTAINKDNISRAAVYGQLARVYLVMSDYGSALNYADECLAQPVKLLNYNTAVATDAYPFKRYNDEVIVNSTLAGNYAPFYAPNGKIDPALYNSYSTNDLRKTLFFVLNSSDQSYSFRGTYLGIKTLFGGIATDEIYLIKAECEARKGNIQPALKALNDLLITRFKTGTYTQVTAGSAAEAVTIILQERRKELLLRGVRWSDLKRLNNDATTAIDLSRVVDGQSYSLSPQDPRYAFPLPDYVITAYNVPQNPGW